MAARCRDCRAEITWARSTATGRMIPLDLYPDPGRGSVRKRETRDETGRIWADILRGESLHRAIANSDPLYVLHRETCTAKRPPNPKPAHIKLDLPRRTPRWRR